ncbi:glycine--tRNA ligase subunit beta [Sphingomonas naphthae]|uniref:Glycine--tRNA ligase beta subunit n=1 Tax=Sphingomonas naphthae TaxID=1813468 RepID=A0ABY7TTN9_9SPHN|nr:glycine--tRNA ligase subunit beta [Sphingomonas naphthae]WCT75234.1 glycine--tRNA ligase subunit beta [Sphingomonas naphthae]
MTDFLLELLSEEIPARMQEKACADLARLFAAEIGKAGLTATGLETYATPRRLALIARGLPLATQAVREELKGPRAGAPPQALEGFLRKTGLSADQLVDRGGVLFAVIEKPGRATAEVLAEAVPAIVRGFPWPKSMRWGAASASTSSLRWVRPLKGIVALLGQDVVPIEVEGVTSGAETVGHRFHHPGIITIGGADDYAAKLRACHVILDPAERQAIIREGAARAAAARGLTVAPDEGLVAENAGLTEWPVPLLGDFDPAFLAVPREVIQLTMRTNQKYFACLDAAGELAPTFICTANIEAADGGEAIVAGNRKVLAARLSDAKFFWEQDLKVPLAESAKKLGQIVFHEKLGTVADKVERVAKLARWLVESDIVKPRAPAKAGAQGGEAQPNPGLLPSQEHDKKQLADMAQKAAELCKADLVTGMVGEFPELQGVMGGYYARAEGLAPQVADAIRDHYKPVGQGDAVPTAPVTVAVSLADKLDAIAAFFSINEKPTGSKDPFALRRAALAIIRLIVENHLTLDLRRSLVEAAWSQPFARPKDATLEANKMFGEFSRYIRMGRDVAADMYAQLRGQADDKAIERAASNTKKLYAIADEALDFFADRLKVQQKEAGVRHDLIDAVFALGGEDDLVRLLARVKALQGFVGTEDGANLLAGYKRATNILKKEAPESPSPQRGEGRGEGARTGGERPALADGADAQGVPPFAPLSQPSPRGGEGFGVQKTLSYTPEKAETALMSAIDSAEPRAAAAVAAEDFEGAMAALASLRAPIDGFFDQVTVNDADPAKRAARLALLARVRAAVHQVADFSRIEG